MEATIGDQICIHGNVVGHEVVRFARRVAATSPDRN